MSADSTRGAASGAIEIGFASDRSDTYVDHDPLSMGTVTTGDQKAEECRVKNCLRHMRTTQERRRWFADAPDIRLRGSRSPKLLPSLWDDLWRHKVRSWKAHRATKYRRMADMSRITTL